MKQVTLDGVDVIEVNDYSEEGGVTEITIASEKGEAVCMTAKGEDLEVYNEPEVKAESTVYTDGDRFVPADILEIFEVWLDAEPTPENVEKFKRHHDDNDTFYDSDFNWSGKMYHKMVKSYDTLTKRQKEFIENGGADSKWN